MTLGWLPVLILARTTASMTMRSWVIYWGNPGDVVDMVRYKNPFRKKYVRTPHKAWFVAGDKKTHVGTHVGCVKWILRG